MVKFVALAEARDGVERLVTFTEANTVDQEDGNDFGNDFLIGINQWQTFL